MILPAKQHASLLFCFPLALLLSGCGEQGPECGSPDARNSVVRIVKEDRNNRLLNFAVENSSTVEEMLRQARAEADKSAIREKAKQDAVYGIDESVVVNSRSPRQAVCTGLLSVTVGDATVQKDVEFRIEQAADGKISISVKPFLF
jgi:hypothetical protein